VIVAPLSDRSSGEGDERGDRVRRPGSVLRAARVRRAT
jgi:hypothetical protein